MGEVTVVGVYGFSDSGKTRLLTAVIPRLVAEGLRVAAVKCSEHELSLDVAGKDTDVLRKAGASVVVFSGKGETDFFVPRALSMQQMRYVLADSGLGEIDLILVEGVKDAWIPKIRVGECPERANTIARCSGDVDDAVRVIKEAVEKQRSVRSSVSITVNGKEIPLTEFPESIISNVLVGLLASLKGVGEVHEARFSLSCRTPDEKS